MKARLKSHWHGTLGQCQSISVKNEKIRNVGNNRMQEKRDKLLATNMEFCQKIVLVSVTFLHFAHPIFMSLS